MHYHIRQRNKARRDFSKFSALIAAPSDFSAPIVLPANAHIWISASANITQGQISVEVGSRTIVTPALVASRRRELGWFERGQSLDFTLAAGPTFTLYINVLGKFYPIAVGEAP